MGTGAVESSSENADDWRMFPMDKLYCEGKLKPIFRGYIHVFGVIAVIPFILYNLWEDIDKKIEYIAMTILVVGNIICWGASSLFHCVPWKPKEEIFIQKIDHSAVFLQIACNSTPVALLVLHHMPHHDITVISFTKSLTLHADMILFFMLVNFVVVMLFGCYGVWHVFCRRGQRLIYWIGMIVLTFPSYPIVATYMTRHERVLFLLVLFLNLVGAIIFRSKLHSLQSYTWYQRISIIFGYHEIFHVITVLGTVSLYYVVDSLNQNSFERRCLIQEEAWKDNYWLFLWKELIVLFQITADRDFCNS